MRGGERRGGGDKLDRERLIDGENYNTREWEQRRKKGRLDSG